MAIREKQKINDRIKHIQNKKGKKINKSGCIQFKVTRAQEAQNKIKYKKKVKYKNK